MSWAKTILKKIRRISSTMDIDYDPKTNEFTQYSNDRFLLQELLMLYDEQQKENERLKEALKAYEEGGGK